MGLLLILKLIRGQPHVSYHLLREKTVKVPQRFQRLFRPTPVPLLYEQRLKENTGLLQFFIGSDDVWGMDFDDMTNTGGFRVFYWETVDPSVTKADAAAIFYERNGSLCIFPERVLYQS